MEKVGQIQQLDLTGVLYSDDLKPIKSAAGVQNMCAHAIHKEAGEKAVSGYSQNHTGGRRRVSLLSTSVQLKPFHMVTELNAENNHHEFHICLDHQVVNVCLEHWV